MVRRVRYSLIVVSSALILEGCQPSIPPEPPVVGRADHLPPTVHYEPPPAPTAPAPRKNPMLKAEELNRGLPRPKSFPQIEFQRFRTTDGYHAEFLMTNATPHSFVYDGYAPQNPVYELQRWVGSHWEAAGPGWCGMGLGQLLLAPSESMSFSVNADDERGTIRVGVRYFASRSDRGKEVWSDEVRQPARSLGVPPSELDKSNGAIVVTPDVTLPQLVERVEPVYPEVLVRARIAGKVVLKAVVDERGNVEGVEVVGTSQPLFDDAVLKAVMKWRYKPAMKAGHPVKVPLRIVVKFELPKTETATSERPRP